jgi:8-oxo-dGTP diphosphatase
MKNLLNKMKVLQESKNGKVVTFDWDNTVVFSHNDLDLNGEQTYVQGGVNSYIVDLIKSLKAKDYTVLIVTARDRSLEQGEDSVQAMVDKLQLPVDGIFFTNGEKKAQKLYELGSTIHYDDDATEHEAIVAFRNLHPDFNMLVKYPDETLKDTNEVSKGFIMLADETYLILKRSDTGEWDIPGGHGRSGESPSYAFFREVREETGIELTQAVHLESTEVVYNNNEEIIHYFLGYSNWTSDDLDKVITLCNENSEYYAGGIGEIEEKAKEGATRLLKDVIPMVEDDPLLEGTSNYQQRVKVGHSKMKKRLIGLGKSKTTGAKGLKRVKDYTRSKSAPVGFGGSLEESENKEENEQSRTIKVRILSQVDEKRKKKKKKKSKKRKSSKYWPYWGYGGYSTDSGSGGDAGGDGGGGE